MVVDSSALLAIAFDEAQAPLVISALKQSKRSPLISAVNATEYIIRFLDTFPDEQEAAEQIFLSFDFECVPVDYTLAVLAARTRLQFNINLGDCYCYALANKMKLPILTLDRDFSRTDAELIALD